jgi:hypothetical protein
MKRNQLLSGCVLLALAALPVCAADAHPDLSGVWAYVVDLPPFALKREANGTAAVAKLSSGIAARGAIAGSLPSTPVPAYKREFQAKVADLFDHENKTDPVFYCGKPGVPRIGVPRKIIQSANEVVLFYEDISGDPYRIIPVVAKAEVATRHHPNGNPSAYGDSVAYWDGTTLVVDVTNFADDTWFGEGGYFHTDAMHVTERLWKVDGNLAYQATVEDPKVLAAPWTMAARVVKPSNDPLEESPRCVEDDGHRLLNNDHHRQR